MKVLIACEFSGIVREAFRTKGHEAYSCDLLPDRNGNWEHHFQADVYEYLGHAWDLSGNRYYAGTQARLKAIEFFLQFLETSSKRVCVKNPVGVISTAIRPPDQYIQPWQFGHGETKKTGLWLKNLPKLIPTNIVEGREQRIWKMPPSKDRGYLRSITYQGIADAMAEQWDFE